MPEKGPPPAYSSVQNNEYSGKRLVWDPVQQMHVIAGEDGRSAGNTSGGGRSGGTHLTKVSPTIHVSNVCHIMHVSQGCHNIVFVVVGSNIFVEML